MFVQGLPNGASLLNIWNSSSFEEEHSMLWSVIQIPLPSLGKIKILDDIRSINEYNT